MTQAESQTVAGGAGTRATRPLLFDLSEIDLGAVAVDRAGLERCNPHRGPIVQLDGVVWHAPDFTRGVAVKRVRDDEFWVSGHFPTAPVMPGVLMIEAGAQLSSFLFYSRRGEPCIAGFTRIDNTVFRGVVRPGDTLYLLSNQVKWSERRFISDLQGLVDDRIVFESRITGMVLPNVEERSV
jgi:3-hydroxyacyl-[acyl-carrier-protein] dehydratase